MSVQAMTWAFKQPIRHSSAKFVLVVMANCADADMLCWPSCSHLIAATGQDRKTIIENVHRLREWGYLEDTGERKGITKQVHIYRLRTPENVPAKTGKSTENGILAINKVNPKIDENSPKNGTVPAEQTVLELELNGFANRTVDAIGKSTEKGTINNPENGTLGTIPKTGLFVETKSAVFPHKESRFSVERVPKTGHGTINEPSKNIKTPISPLPKFSAEKKKNIKKKKPEPTNPTAFEKFWSAYPRKERKPSAIVAFNDLNPDEELLETILGAIAKARSSDKWKANGGQFILGPVRYLNEEGWNDVIEIETKADKFGWDAAQGRHTRPNL